MTEKKDSKKTLENQDPKDLENLGLGYLANKLIIETVNYINGQWPEGSLDCSKEKYNDELLQSYLKKKDKIIEELNQREKKYKDFLSQSNLKSFL